MSNQTQAELPSEIFVIIRAHHSGHLNQLIAANNLFYRTSISDTTSYDTNARSTPSLPDLSALKLGVSSGRLSVNEALSRGSLGSVHRGAFDGLHDATSASSSTSVIIKLVVGEDKLVLLRHEATIYQRAKRLQGSVLPRNFGFYENEKQTIGFILLEDCGFPYGQSFEGLSDGNKLALMQALKQLHDFGIEHGDLQPWNVLNHNGSPRIVDLHLAMMFHTCPAKAQVMTEEFCSREGISELVCEELVAVGGRMMFRSQDQILYG